MRSRTLYLTALLATIFLVLLLAATLATRGTKAALGTLYVSTSGSDSNDCSTVALACRTVQRAINVATTGDEIRVATGTYTDTAYTVAEITETITLRGGWDANFTIPQPDPEAYPTTLDAQGLGRVIQIQGTYPNISPTIDGFIITRGNANGEDFDVGMGGGIYSHSADPIIQNNVITNNIASTISFGGYGGGLYLWGSSASALISGNQILSNTASTGLWGWGGGLYLKFSDATLSGNTISNNAASTAASGYGGGLALMVSEAALDGNRIINNMASSYGGGLYVFGSAPFTLTNNIIAQNEAGLWGGGMHVFGWDSNISSGKLINNTIAQNKGGVGEGVLATGGEEPGITTLSLTNNIIVSHTYGIFVEGTATVIADYTLFFGNGVDTWGPITSTHQVSGDPLFVDPSAWDYHIQVASPAVNKGTFTGAPSTDFEGDARPYDCFIDIGADENTASDYCQRIYLPLILKNY